MKRFVIIVCIALMGTATAFAANNTKASRSAKKEAKAEEYIRWTNDLIFSTNYSFRTESGEGMGFVKFVPDYYRINVREDFIDIFLPYIQGNSTPRKRDLRRGIGMGSIRISNTNDYRAELSEDGTQWLITFSDDLYSTKSYRFKMVVDASTGKATLEISSPNYTDIIYDGYIQQIF